MSDTTFSATPFPKVSAMNSTQQFLDNMEPTTGIGKWVCHLLIEEGVIGVLGNLLVCFVILRVKFLHTMTNYLLVNLAVADMLVCLECIFYGLIYYENCKIIDYVPKTFGGKVVFCCFLQSNFLGWALSYASAYNLCVVTFERYVALVHPLQYARKLTATRMKTLIALIWVTSFLFSLPFLFTLKPSNDPDLACSEIEYQDNTFHILLGVFAFFLSYLLPLTLMSWAYYKIHVTLKRQAKALNLQHARAAAYDLVIARQRLVRMLTMVLGALIILWTPINTNFLLCINPTFSFCGSKGFKYFEAITCIMLYFNSVINPIIYELKYKKFRQGLKLTFCCCHKSHGANTVDIAMVPL
ncbi:LOW QUALITY PROTEIN: neuromedin-U receptor 2-like [Patiria miniata]|uniref:G-protein coupled receptors family 1 profile domain-containing protein n=1 Tax=Patiria miniata TaxID=46514 RepID=A0A914B459_PATMI|nr:LOW QUALITY PROTEIN: neuromedin-U receptor 2-like [Patiria miniata]